MKRPAKRHRIFLSHHSGDLQLAQRLATDLRKRDRHVWISSDSITVGEDWVASISQAIEDSSIFLVVLTEASVASDWVQQEVNTAIARERKRKIRLIPLVFEPCSVPPLWDVYQAISFQSRYATALKQLDSALDGSGAIGLRAGVPAHLRAAYDVARLYDALYPRLLDEARLQRRSVGGSAACTDQPGISLAAVGAVCRTEATVALRAVSRLARCEADDVPSTRIIGEPDPRHTEEFSIP